jgi:chromosome segregation ATPase
MSDNQHIDQVLQEMRAQLNILTTDFNTSRAKLKQETAKANAIIGLLSPEENDAIQEYTEYTIDELSNEISAIDTRLSMMAEGNPNAIKAYEKREQDIKTAQEKLENRAYDLEATRAKITEIREQWEPELDKLVSKISDGFSHNFDMIGCAGQVGVYKDEDFEKWSIQIQVRFR